MNLESHSFVYFSDLGVLDYDVLCIEVTDDKYRHTKNFYSESEVFDLESIWEDDPSESDFSAGDTPLEVEQTSPSTGFEIPHTDLLELTE